MTHKDIIKKTLEFNRQGFERVFETAENVNEKAEEITGKTLEQIAFVPDQAKHVLKSWIDEGRLARKGFREAVLGGFERLEDLVKAA